MSQTRREILTESRKKGIVAGVAAVATVALGTVSLPVAAVAAVPAAILGWGWWKHRAKNGIRF